MGERPQLKLTPLIMTGLLLLVLSACCQSPKPVADSIPRMTAAAVIEVAKKHLQSVGIDPQEYEILLAPEYKEGVWLVIFEEIDAPLDLRTTSYGVFVDDLDSKPVYLSPGI